MNRILSPALLAVCALSLTQAPRAWAVPGPAPVTFLGVASGDASSTGVTVWTRAVNDTTPAEVSLTLQISTDPAFSTISTVVGTTSAAKDYILKLDLTGLTPATTYYYRFVGPLGETSIRGRFKTAPAANASVAVHFGSSGDMDGLIRPYALASVFANQNLDFFANLGDVIYENGSTVTGNIGLSYTNSPSVTLSGTIPGPSATGATQSQLFNDYSKKYREQFLPVNVGGQNGLQPFYAAQGMYTIYDNHELGNRQYINGGAPAGGTVGSMTTGAGVDARVSSNDTNTSSSDYMNRSTGFLTLQQVFLNYMPIADRGTVSQPAEPRIDGTKQLFSSQKWGKNLVFLNVDDRTYRDIRMKTSGNKDETGSRADNTNRTMLSKTQLQWVKDTLLDAQTNGIVWKFIAVSDPIDQLGPIGGALSLNNLPNFGTNSLGQASSYSAVSSDGGKSWIGGYRAERNDLLKFIADHHIRNVVFLSADDHQNRVNELTYSTNGVTGNQTTYVKVPDTFAVVMGPLGATGPDLIYDHSFSVAKQLSDSIEAAQSTAGVEPIGLKGYPGLHNVVRENDPNADTTRTGIDFYSPDTFNFASFDVTADGKTLSVATWGITATEQNSALEYNAATNAVRSILSFQIDTAYAPTGIQFTRGGLVLNRRTGRWVQNVTVSNTSGAAISENLALVVDGLSSNATLFGATGSTSLLAPIGSSFVKLPVSTLNAGQSVTVSLEFVNPTNGKITYTPRLTAGAANP
jgi:phosphodiesterase/alkaline phosphatase D-like protein